MTLTARPHKSISCSDIGKLGTEAQSSAETNAATYRIKLT